MFQDQKQALNYKNRKAKTVTITVQINSIV